MSEFNATESTARLQDAVRRHDRVALGEFVSDEFVFMSARALGRLGKAEWIDAAMQVSWRSFDVAIARVIWLPSVVIVDHDIEQDIEAPPGWAAEAPTRSTWITTDVWTDEDGHWRLVARHPELRG